MARLALQEERRLIREGLAVMLDAEPDVDVVAAVATPRELVACCRSEHVDVAVIRVSVTSTLTANLVTALRRHSREMTVLGRHNGTSGSRLIEPPSPVDMIVADVDGAGAILAAVCGVVSLQPAHGPTRSPGARVPALSARERQILELVASGLTASEVSRRLAISPKTVESHKQRIFTRLGVQNQAHAVAVALEAGLLVPIQGRAVGA